MAREQGRRIECGGFTLWYVAREKADVAPPQPSLADSDCPALKTNPLPIAGPRVGVVASTAAVGCAVQRNRAKRRLREVFRHHQSRVPAQLDLLLIARRSLNQLAYAEIEKKFVEACARLPRLPGPSQSEGAS